MTVLPFGTPYWWEDGADLPDLPETPPEKAELLIIGAGFTGLSAAITAQRAGAKVTVIDAIIPGQGASSRNGGMFGPHSRISLDAMTRSFGRDTAVALLNEAPKGFEFTRALIKTEGIDCDVQPTGRILLAPTRKIQAEQVKQAEALKKLTGYELEIVPRDKIGAHIGSDLYAGAVYYRDHAGLHPRKFHDGLMALALKIGVRVVQNCPVLSVSGKEGGFRVETENGGMTAEKLIFATNGYTGARFGWLARRIFALPSFIIATEALPPELIDRLAPGRRMMVENWAKHSYFRVSPDGTRILFGGRAGMVPFGPKFAARRLKSTMVDIWPDLKDVKITHSWRGNTGFTFEQMPHVGQHDGRYFALGYSGSGVALAPYLGMKVAHLALGDHKKAATAYAQTTPTTRVYHRGGHPFFLAAGEVWYRQVVDRVEDYQRRRDRARD